MVRAVLTAFLLLLPAMASGQGEKSQLSQVEALAGQAQVHYKAGRFDKAVALYLEAWRLAPAAAVLYNIAHIYDRKLGERSLAIDFYRRYISATDADPEAVQRATKRVQELKVEEEKARIAMPPPDSGGGANRPRARARRSGTSGREMGGWVAVGAGGLLVVTGSVFGILASDKADRFADTDEVDRQSLRESGQTQALIADVMLGVGVAAAATGVVLLMLPDSDASALRVAPIEGGAMLGFGGAL